MFIPEGICTKLTFWNVKQINAPRTTKEKGRGPQNAHHCSVPLLVCSFSTLKCTRSSRSVFSDWAAGWTTQISGFNFHQGRETFFFFFFFCTASLPNQRPTQLAIHWIPRIKRPGLLRLVSHVCLLRGAWLSTGTALPPSYLTSFHTILTPLRRRFVGSIRKEAPVTGG